MTRDTLWLGAVLALALGAVPSPALAPKAGELASLARATAWLNSPPLTAAALRGKVVLIDVWTYSCINWLRTLPYVHAWADKYKDQDLVVIGVHAPEFPFEHSLENVRWAAREMGVTYPIALDNDYAIWRAFSNNYWPAVYLVDAEGRVRYHHFGEGGYQETERAIQEMLGEAGKSGIGHDLAAVDPRPIEIAADWSSLKTSETYVGYERAENLASPGGAAPDARRSYVFPSRLELNQWALSGEWTVGKQATVVHNAGGRIAFQFHARDLHLVMGPAAPGTTVRFRVLIDGQPPGPAHGLDLDAQGYGTATGERLYQLIRQPMPVKDRRFEIEFLDPGMEVFSFTFG